MTDFEYAKDKVLMGAERKSMIITDEEKRNTAYHEAGHALVGGDAPRRRPGPQGHDHPARPRPRRHACSCPTEDKYTYTKEYLDATIAILMGGRDRRGDVPRPASPPAPATTSSRPPTWRARWSASGA